ncbi:hypothetical protein F1C10_06420 [Sphingomonas sp. NBWT7]|uniref:hypothetical protein n=1 Tax=Sphingomonas sp. NBWT7 TaxID=2596913 RepID=UPI001624A000|nr:hypothetical protein [Sphingomonas sp. NBWT7]QNE31599.1 hypothetical protein F1C10_06420 [Sphingomonas sp. NBWT7]
MSPHRTLLPLMLGVALAGCSATGRSYPPLLPRAAEQQSFAEPTAPPPVPAAPDPALDTRIAATSATLAARVKAFDAASATARQKVASAGRAPAGSESWLDAQVTLAELDSLRSATLEVVTDLETIAGERAADLAAPYAPLETTIAQARAAAAKQAATIAELQGRLSPA